MYPSFDSWVAACDMMRRETARFRSYAQWYPFSQLSAASWELLRSEKYYHRFIEDGAFVLPEHMRFTTRGFVQKQGTTMRESYLVAPVLYLFLLAAGIEYANNYVDPRPGNMVCLYAGDLERRWAHYRRGYRAFRAAIGRCSTLYDHCIKTDITNFFGSINVDSLIAAMRGCAGNTLSISDCLFLRAVLLYCGRGRFPTIQNHATLSFLATRVYLGRVDSDLFERLSATPGVLSFELVRYVDDLYVFFDLSEGANLLNTRYAITKAYSDLLRSDGLTLNQEKLGYLAGSDASRSMAAVSCIESSGHEAGFPTEFNSQQIVTMFSFVCESVRDGRYSHDVFLRAVHEGFYVDGMSVEPMAAFRQCLFGWPKLFRNDEVVRSIAKALAFGNVTLSFSTAAMVQCVLNTRDEALVKRLLNNLFTSERCGAWSSLDSLIALTYLQQRGMSHRDLLECLKRMEPRLAWYCASFCRQDFTLIPLTDAEQKVIDILKDDKKSKMLYMFSLYQNAAGNVLEDATYYRAFFDRFTSQLNSKIQGRRHKWLYAEKDLKKVYECLSHAAKTIRSAEKMRQGNPLVHANSDVIESPTLSKDVIALKKSLSDLMIEYLKTIDRNDINRSGDVPAKVSARPGKQASLGDTKTGRHH